METDDVTKIVAEIEAAVKIGEYSFEKCATRLDPNGPYHAQDVIAAIIASEGVIVNAARLLARRRMSLRDYIYRNPAILEFFEDYFEGNLDIIERNMVKEALASDITAMKFILASKGKSRGYGTSSAAVSLDPRTAPFDGFTLTITPGLPPPHNMPTSEDDDE